ncbi:MAG: ADP-glyceromanno-heptose 6-epimerase [Candidatus Firestonebacteria bacterium]
MRVVVTGGAGFIGSCLIAKLNAEGIDDIIVVDRLGQSESWKNLVGKRFTDYIDRDSLAEHIKKSKPGLILHMGACSSTTETNVSFLMENNYRYTRMLAEYSVAKKVPFLYASSAATYGGGEHGYSDENESSRKLVPLNAYGYSKQIFDIWALDNGLDKKITGFKFFNVFGPNEYHKGDMKSVIAKSYPAILRGEGIKLFKSYKKEYKHGEQKRDFLYIKDAVEIVWYFVKNPAKKGIFNVGTGRARSWNDVAKAMFAAAGKKPVIKYIDMPLAIRDKYQYFTEADTTKLNKSGCPHKCMELEAAVKDYSKYLEKENYI